MKQLIMENTLAVWFFVMNAGCCST